MPALDPLAADVMKLFKIEDFEECSAHQPLTRIVQRNTSAADDVTPRTAYLVLDENRRKSFQSKGQKLDCCYQEIVRSGVNKTADEKFK